MQRKTYFNFQLPYFKNKQFGLVLIRFSNKGKARLQLSFYTTQKLIDINGHEDDWGYKKLKHLILWKNY